MMDNSNRVAILSFSTIQSDSRVLRQVEYLSRHFAVDVIGYGHLPSALAERARMLPVATPSTQLRRLRKAVLLPLGRIVPLLYDFWYWHEHEFRLALELLLQLQPDIIHANDWESLPVALRAAEKMGTRVVADLHEYAPLMRENRRYWRLFYKPLIEHFLPKCLPHVAASVTVNQTIADKYAEVYGLQPIAVMNAPRCVHLPPFRATDPENVRLVFHGDADPDRRLEGLIETVALAQPRYSLHLMLIERNRGYGASLRALAERLAPGRVFFYPPVAPNEVIGRIAEWDIGFYLMPLSNFNFLASLPNKFFDFIMAGLSVCIGPSLEMGRLTQEYGFGLVTPSLDPREVAGLLNHLSPADIDQMKQRAIAAREVLNADVELGKLVQLYFDLLKGD